MAQKKLGVRGGINLAAAFTDRGDATLLDAQNYFQDVPGVLRSRRGYARSSDNIGAPIYKIASPIEINGQIVINNGGLTFPTELHYSTADGATFANISGGFTNTSLEERMQVMSARGNLYATEDRGVFAMPVDLSTAAANLRFAGQTMGSPVSTAQSFSESPTLNTVGTDWFPVGQAAAYRVVHGRMDSTGEILGAPSGRGILVSTAAGAGQPLLYMHLNAACNTGSTPMTAGVDWLDIYRSKTRLYTDGEPDDEMRLIIRYYPTAGEIAGGFVQLYDIVTDDVWERGEFLYTNANTGDVGLIGPDGAPQRGVSLGNETPPKSKAMAMWNNRGWYADVRVRPTYSFSFVALPIVGEIIQVDGVDYTSIAAGPPGAQQWVIVNTGVLSYDLMMTSSNFVAAVNNYTGNTTIYAQYTGTTETDPGNVTLYRRDFGVDFTVAVSQDIYYNPQPSQQPTSEPADFPGRVYFSKDGEPEAVPVVNYFQIGSITSRIHQIVPRRSYLYCFSDAGLYRVAGTDENDFSVELVEPRCHLVARETAVTGSDGLIYACCKEGIAQIDDGGVAWIQGPIETAYRFALDRAGEEVANTFWYALASPRWQTVAFFISGGSVAPSGGYVWNIPSRAWTRWDFPRLGQVLDETRRSCACIQATTSKMLFSNGQSSTGDARIMFEQLDFNSDYHLEMTPNGTTGGIGHSVSWWPFMEAPDVKSVFREVHASFWGQVSDGIDQIPLARFSFSTGAAISTVNGTTPVAVSPSSLASPVVEMPQSYLSRSLVPYPVARGRSLTVTVDDNETANSSMPMECITIIYEPYTTKDVT